MAAPRRTPSAPPATFRIGSLPGLALALSILGLILGLAVLYIHGQIAASQGTYTSFCDVSAEFSCSDVLGSAYASFFGIPVAAWALLAYVGAAFLSVATARAAPDRRLPTATALLALSGAILAISLYFLVVATFVIGVACPFCLTMDVVNVALFAVALAIFLQESRAAQAGYHPGRLLTFASAATAIVIAVLTGVQAAERPSDGPLTLEQIKDTDPRFYAFYISQPTVDAPLDGDSASGDAAITIVEFSDYQCPYCKRAYIDLGHAIAENPAGIRLIHKNFPLNSDCNPAIQSRNHENACIAAAASECAHQLKRGDEYGRLLFMNQDSLGRESLLEYSKQVGLDPAAFERCMDAPDTQAAVARDVKTGRDAGVESTPTLFINGRLIKGGFTRPDQYRYALAIERDRVAKAKQAATP